MKRTNKLNDPLISFHVSKPQKISFVKKLNVINSTLISEELNIQKTLQILKVSDILQTKAYIVKGLCKALSTSTLMIIFGFDPFDTERVLNYVEIEVGSYVTLEL